MKNHITIIGAGNLTQSLLRGMELSKVKKNINLVDIDKKKRILSGFHRIEFNSHYTDTISKSDFILLMIKPKDYEFVLKSVNSYLSENTIILSFMAGITIADIQRALGSNITIVRCMTNLTISKNRAFLFYNMKSLNKKDIKKTEEFISLFANIKKCKDEKQIDMLTALYGSGPAYYIFFNEIINNAFLNMGFNKKETALYTNNLMLGTSKLIQEEPEAGKLLKSIASKGGTTEAALTQLKKNKVDALINKAIQQAYKKSRKILLK